MARFMVLYSDDEGEGRCAIIDDHRGTTMPYGSLAEDAINDLPDYNAGGTTFILELTDDVSEDPVVICNDTEIARQFVDID